MAQEKVQALPDATAKSLRFNKNGKFNIMHLTDTHLEYENVEASVWLMAAACDREQPDLVVLTGDNVHNYEQAAAKKSGVTLTIVSGYRSYQHQTNTYNRYVNRDGKAKADTYSARPGHSEHQTGLAMDLNSLYTSFANTKEGKWLAANAHKYGFIIRYPNGKTAQTGYIYEPWHVRYVGTDKAAKIYNSGLCLEEYYGITSVYAN